MMLKHHVFLGIPNNLHTLLNKTTNTKVLTSKPYNNKCGIQLEYMQNAISITIIYVTTMKHQV